MEKHLLELIGRQYDAGQFDTLFNNVCIDRVASLKFELVVTSVNHLHKQHNCLLEKG